MTMEPGRQYNKSVTSTMQFVTNTGVVNRPGATLKTSSTETSSQNPHFLGEDESIRTLTGANMGGIPAANGTIPKQWGHIMPSGTQLTIDDTPGAEQISMVLHNGAGIQVEPDGAVYISSDSKRGAGLSAPKGDISISAGGEISIVGPGSISIKTAGDLNFDVGGTLNMVASAIKTSTKILDENIDGTASRHVTQDQSLMVGGISRITVAGDQREQITGENILDIGKGNLVRIGANNDISVGSNSTMKSGANTAIHAKTATSITAGTDIITQSTAKTTIISKGDMELSSSAKLMMTAAADLYVATTAVVRIIGTTVSAMASSVINIFSSGTAQIASPSTYVTGAGVLHLASAMPMMDVPIPGPTPVIPVVEAAPAVKTAATPTEPTKAEVTTAEDIVDSMTSARKYPDYPGNGVREHANSTNLGRISHDKTDQAEEVYNEFSGKNQGNTNPKTPGDSITTLPETPVDKDPNVKANDPGIEVPARHNNSAKISKYFTLGELVNAGNPKHVIPEASWNSVVKNFTLVASNVLDQIKEKFPDIIITSAYRKNSRNHITGQAIDMVVPSRSMLVHAEIARYAKDNLPCQQVFLEKNDSGRTHVHVRVSESGSAGTPTVLTCGDPQCNSKTPGINVEWLQRRM